MITLGNTTSVGASGSHVHNGTVLAVIVESYSNWEGTAINGATFDGVSLTLACNNEQSYGGADNSEVWIGYLASFPKTATVAVSITGGVIMAAYAISLIQAHTISPLVAASTSDDGGYAAALTSEADGMSLCVAGSRTNGHTLRSGTAEFWDMWTGGVNHGSAGGYRATTGATVEIGWEAVAGCFAFASFRPAPALSGSPMWWS